jgi:superfamily II DNA or RNA helicase
LRLSFSAGTLLLEGASRQTVGRLFGPALEPWVWDPRVGAWRCDALEYAAVVERFRQARQPVEDLVPAWQPVRWPQVQIHPLRPEQQAAVDAWLGTVPVFAPAKMGLSPLPQNGTVPLLPTQKLGQSRRGLIVMPTGTGKTEVALSLMAQTAVSTLVVAPVRDLMYQWHRRILASLGYDAGVIGDNVFRVRPVSVTTYDSACIHAERFGDQFGLLVFDECHHLPGPVRQDAARMSAAPMRLGLTATPERSDGRHVELDRLIGPVVYEMPIADAKGQTLADYEVVRIPVHLSDAERARYNHLAHEVRRYIVERRQTDPEYGWQDLCAETAATPQARRALRAYFAKKSIEDRAEEKLRVLEDLFRLHAGEPCMVFCGSNAMARDVATRFLIPCLLNHCGKKERLEILQGLAEGSYPALVANQVLDEGVDLPAVKVAVVIGGTSSSRQAKQRLGRILRKSGNSRAVLYEIVSADTAEEHRSRRRRTSDAYQGTRHRKM